MTDHIDATQEDIAAAKAWVNRPRGHSDEQADALEAFTRHRLASTAALQAERDELAEILIKIAATVTQDASGRWYFDLGDPEQLLSDACAAVGYDVVIAARDALGEG